ncbi:MAG: PAS domain S-box protein [Deltaproteobacteria bacterium]|nr:PAS domain S-box protein [Deltaproteobacteria bacterium]
MKKLLEDAILREQHSFILKKTHEAMDAITSNTNALLLIRTIPTISEFMQAEQTAAGSVDKSNLQQWKERFVTVTFEALELNKNWDQLFCLNAQGKMLLRVSRSPDGKSILSENELEDRSGNDYFKEAIKPDAKGAYVSPLKLEKEKSGNIEVPLLYFSVPILEKAGNLEGVLVIRYRPNSLLDELSQASLGSITITDQDGYFISHPEAQKKFSLQRGNNYNLFWEYPDLKKETTSFESNDYKDVREKQYHVWRKINYAPDDPQHYWILFSSLPEKTFFAAIYKFRDISLSISFIIFLLGIALIYLVINNMMEPLQQLEEGAKIIGSGDLNYRLDIKRKDEIGELASAFDQMANNLKKITQAEQDNRTAFQSMFEHANVGLIIVTEKGEIKEVNPYANRLFGYSKKELLGKPIEVLVPTRFQKKHVGHRDHYIEKPESGPMRVGMHLLALRKDGSEFLAELSLASYVIGGEREVVSFVTDITERKKAEEALKKLNLELEEKVNERTHELSQTLLELNHINYDLNLEMEYRKKIAGELAKALKKEKELSELKLRFVSMASHEFRTPLAGILTSVDLINRYQNPADYEKRLRHINSIKSSVRNLTLILNDFLSLDKLEEGKVECHPSSFPLFKFITSFLEDLQFVSKKGQKILTQFQGNDDQVFMDGDILRNILNNLFSNAMKYSPENSEIKLSLELNDTQVILKIEDEGIGIPEEDQKYMFERFFRAHNVTAIQGTGLGLNIIKKYLNLMQGSIDFTSHENKGSTFTVVLPKKLNIKVI